jgi:isocitrate dehydrogenase kinase/phosphatase
MPRPTPSSGSSLGNAGARLICDGFDTGRHAFNALTLRAHERFELRDWRQAQLDSVARSALYEQFIARTATALRALLGPADAARVHWTQVKATFLRLVEGRGDAELAFTFFSSIGRRLYGTVGVDPGVEFLHAASGRAPIEAVLRRLDFGGSAEELARDMLHTARFSVAWADLDRDCQLVAERLVASVGIDTLRGAEIVDAVFFRNKGAYLVGRLLYDGGVTTPLVLALLNEDDQPGVTVDAVLTTEDDASVVFSYTRSPFSVAVESPRALVGFLRELMPHKPLADLYIAIGHHKRAKTEIYRALLQLQRTTSDAFDFVPGAHGMVMIVFAMPSAEQVFKVLRDHFAYPKSITREQVMEKYQLVFEHDRAGRLVDAQEFRFLEFDRHRFSDRLLTELEDKARESVEVRRDTVVVRHVYTERRVVPLDVYLRTAPVAAAVRAVLDYGAAVRDMAATNIFPGDLLLKNFGVTRHGRVVFYDYDEIVLLTSCRFRHLPEAGDDIEEFSEEPWFSVTDGDVFPEEFGAFLGLSGPLREAFLAAHGDLLEVGFWHARQVAIRAGEIIDLFPYVADTRLRAAHRQPIS